MVGCGIDKITKTHRSTDAHTHTYIWSNQPQHLNRKYESNPVYHCKSFFCACPQCLAFHIDNRSSVVLISNIQACVFIWTCAIVYDAVQCSAVQSLEARVHLFMDTLPCTFIHAHQKYHHHYPCFLILNMLTWTFAFGWYLHHVPNSKLLAYNLKPKHTNLKQHTRNKPALPNDSCEFGQIYTHCCHFIYIFLL